MLSAIRFVILVSSIALLTACGGQAFRTDIVTGPQGVAGSPGPSGTVGPSGTNGAAGATGAAGKNGTSGTNGSNGANGAGYVPGLLCDAYAVLPADDGSNVNWFKLLSDGTPEFTAVLPNFNVSNESDATLFEGFTAAQQALIGTANWAIDCSGYIDIPASADYSFTLSSDDGSEFVIDNVSILNMPNTQPMTSKSVSGVALYAGRHTVNVLYFQSLHTNIGLTLEWQGDSNDGLGSLAVIPASAFSH